MKKFIALVLIFVTVGVVFLFLDQYKGILKADYLAPLRRWAGDDSDALIEELRKARVQYWELLDPSGALIDKGGVPNFSPPSTQVLRIKGPMGQNLYLRIFTKGNSGSMVWLIIPRALVVVSIIILAFSIAYFYIQMKQIKSIRHEVERQKQLIYLGEVARGLAHELRNPLNTISMNFQLIEEEIPKDSQLAVRIGRIKRELKRLEENLTNYLRFARPPKPQLKREEINPIVERVVRFFAPECKSEGIDLVLELGHGLSRVLVDEKQVEQALLNILMNAKEVSTRGKRITVKTGEEGSFVFVSVSDEGKGIPAEDLPKIFEPYFTKRPGGSGIGLAVVKRIIEEHSGRVKVNSTLDKGTTFTLYFPQAR